jgi:hypothetical protein
MKPVLALSFLLILTTALVARADVPRPKPSPQYSFSNLEVVPDPKATNAILQIRQSEINNLRASLDGTDKPNVLASISNSRNRTIIAGMLLFMSVSFGGVWLARSARKNNGVGRSQKVAVIALIGIATLGAAAIVTRGNAGPPPSYYWRNLPTRLASGGSVSGPVLLQVVPDSELPNSGAKLILPIKKEPKQKGEDE